VDTARHVARSVARSLLPAICSLPFALVPTMGAVHLMARSFPPDLVLVVRAVSVTTLVIVGCSLVAAAGRASPSRAAVIIAAGALGLSLFPSVKQFIDAALGTGAPGVRAAAYLAGWAAGLFCIAMLEESRVEPLYRTSRIAAALLAAMMAVRVWFDYASRREPRPIAATTELGVKTGPEHGRPLPDVYHIVFDALGRPDVLKSRYGLDLSQTLDGLRHEGFEIEEGGSFANYVQTYLSLASMMNVTYLDSGAGEPPDSESRVPMRGLIEDSAVMRTFRRLAYQIEFIGSSYSATVSHPLAHSCLCGYPLVSEFESIVLRMTPFGDIGLGGLDYRPHREKIRRTLAALQSIAPDGQPTLLFAHIMAPHPPFVLDAAGRDVHRPGAFSIYDGTMYEGTREEYTKGYRAQAAFLAG
jgi:hypothetical protein